ncbi:MAG: hypothetical protein ABIJ97_16930 [Bacteroidota bacterium]
MNVATKIKFILFVFFIAANISVNAQWECRSKLGAHLKSFKKDFPLLWAIEQTSGVGCMTDRNIRNMMLFAGLDYSFKKHQFYFEGGSKGWHNTLNDTDSYNNEHKRKIFQQQRFGIREGFYRYNDKSTNLTIGFHSMTFGDYFLVNERGLGISYIQELKEIKIYLTGASILKDFSRFGSFCSVHNEYNLLRDRSLAYIGEGVGETNFAGFVLKWIPSNKVDSSEFDEFSSSSGKKIFKEVGLIFYNEFGTGIDTIQTDYGLMSQWDLPGKLQLETELLHQYRKNNQTLLYHLNLTKQISFGKKGQTFFSLAYYGKLDIDRNAMAYSSFSNLFIGEVMRMDIMDMPLYQFSMKYQIPKWKTQFKLQSTQQFTDQNISEYDIAVGKTFFNHAKLTLMFCRMDADELEEVFYMLRTELRITF